MSNVFSRLGERGKHRVLRITKIAVILGLFSGTFFLTMHQIWTPRPVSRPWYYCPVFYVLVSRNGDTYKPVPLYPVSPQVQCRLDYRQQTDEDILWDMRTPQGCEVYVPRASLAEIQASLSSEYFSGVPVTVELLSDQPSTREQTVRITRSGKDRARWEYDVKGHRIENPRHGEFGRRAAVFTFFKASAFAMLAWGIIAAAGRFTLYRRRPQPIETGELWATKWWDRPRGSK